MAWCLVLSHAAYKAHQLLKTGNDSSCWLAYQTIRKAVLADSLTNRPRFFGTCEVDESYFGGQFKNLRKSVRAAFRVSGLAKRGRGAKSRKQPVFGIFKRNGQVYLDLVPDTTKAQLTPRIEKTIQPGSRVNSDDHPSYAELVGMGYIHRVVRHGQQEYVVGEDHINGLEGFWGLSKTNMHTYKGIRKPNWIYYLKEMEWRYNYRQLDFEHQVLAVIKLLMSDKIEISYRKEASRLS
jgi:transposase